MAYTMLPLQSCHCRAPTSAALLLLLSLIATLFVCVCVCVILPANNKLSAFLWYVELLRR